MCGQWLKKTPSNLKYQNPNLILTPDCPETYRLQKTYFIQAIVTPDQYKCNLCGVVRWGPNNELLCFEMNHKDGKKRNSLVSNLRLFCPNCRNLCTYSV
jgi:hypothetical protein